MKTPTDVDVTAIVAELGTQAALATDPDEVEKLRGTIRRITQDRPKALAKVGSLTARLEAAQAELNTLDDEIEADYPKWKKVRA